MGLRLGVKPAAARASATWSTMPMRPAPTTWCSSPRRQGRGRSCQPGDGRRHADRFRAPGAQRELPLRESQRARRVRLRRELHRLKSLKSRALPRSNRLPGEARNLYTAGPFSAPEVVMALERTLSIVKPDGVPRNLIGEVYRRFESQGLKIVAARMLRLSRSRRSSSTRCIASARSTGPGALHDLGSRGGAGAGRRERDRRAIGRSWAPPTPRRPPRGPSARTWRRASSERGARLGRQRHRGARDRLFLQAAEICPRS